MPDASDEIKDPLQLPVNCLPGVGSERFVQLQRLKIFTVHDLLLHRPRRYEDRRHFSRIVDLKEQQATTVRGKIVALGLKTFRRGIKSVFEIIVDDGTARLHCRWWNLPFMKNYFKQGDEVFIYGKVITCKPRTMDHPETEVIEEGDEPSIHLNRIVPVYPLTEGIYQRWLRTLIFRILEKNAGLLTDPYPGLISQDYEDHAKAIQKLHFPESLEQTEQARRRLALEEFIELQRGIQSRRKRLQAGKRGLPCAGTNQLIRPFLKNLGFPLTGAQTQVLREIRHDLAAEHPMRRLLQGDVGSGKTAVAACAALMVLESGFSVMLMAPTQILAEQHAQNFERWFQPLDIPVALHTGTTSTRNKLKAGKPGLVIGTHALIETGCEVEKVGLVIIDEQHKFGVAQREKLVRKGIFPHLLVMTATPIPRTLGLTLYGDLDTSVIHELPKGRGTIRTHVTSPDKWDRVLEFIVKKLKEGRQAYLVYARIEESENFQLKSVNKEWAIMQKKLQPFMVALLHGRVPRPEQERVMSEFRAGTVHVLMATSVIEVGVDVPNATVMIIENAEQFGLAQLHQLRGRIGRGAHESHCILISNEKTETARQRLAVMEQTVDGFKISEEDLKLRGPGELLGKDQSGLPPFKFGDLQQDLPLIQAAREVAAQILAKEKLSSSSQTHAILPPP